MLTQDLSRPYPYGLDGPPGIFVISPAFVPPQLQAMGTLNAYHGGVWGMVQEMLAAGLTNQQTNRSDLDALHRRSLRRAHFHVWRAIARNIDWREIELWSAKTENGKLVRMPYGQGGNIVAESCLVQGWSLSGIGNFPPPGWGEMNPTRLQDFMSWKGQAPGYCH